MGLSAELGKFLYRIGFTDLLPADVEAAKGRVLDVISCAIAGGDLPASRAVLRFAKESSRASAP